MYNVNRIMHVTRAVWIVSLPFLLALFLMTDGTCRAAQSANMHSTDISKGCVDNDLAPCPIACRSVGAIDDAGYEQLVREKIKESLMSSYRPSYERGDINLAFTLRFDGTLETLEVKSAGSALHRKLIDIVLASVKKAAPFPPFPRTVPLSKMSFSIVISFRDA